ncbi:cadherin-like beta sandwich domain-containing protein, partial [Patescibacteria group bacterium]|nr:cadherin-like beta sandwich domain-containing protein [Patescibacteria group bacterium]
ILYVNDGEAKKVSIAKDGSFSISSVKMDEGANTVSAKQIDANGNISDLSDVLPIRIKRTPPSLEVSSPSDNSTVEGDTGRVTVSGKTEEDVAVTINGRLAVVAIDGSFHYDFPLAEGDNTLTIKATDPASNQTTIERHVTYKK